MLPFNGNMFLYTVVESKDIYGFMLCDQKTATLNGKLANSEHIFFSVLLQLYNPTALFNMT